MVTLDELKTEQVWRDEVVPNPLRVLRQDLLNHFGWDVNAIGTVGDFRHLSGYHRSRGWILHSRFCVNRSYSVTETEGNRNGGRNNYVAAMDVMRDAERIAANLRRDKALGLLPMVRQIILESNPVHCHVSFDRGALESPLTAVFDSIVGNTHGGVKMVQVNVVMPELSQGATGADVKTCQTLLNLRSPDLPALKVDGEFGPFTDGRVRHVQQKFAAESVDGRVGPETWTILLAGQDQN